MGRERISMKLIQNEKSRKTTFQKRKKGLLKKANELSILCDVDVCVILYAPNFEGEGFAEPETWPKDTNEVQRILQKYYNTTVDRRHKVYHLQEYFQERLKKVAFEISKVRKQRLKIMYPTWDEAFDSLRGNELKSLISTLDSRYDSCCQKMDFLNGKAIMEQSHPSTSILISNPSSYLNPFVNNMFQEGQCSQPSSMISSAQAFYQPLQLGQCSQPSSMISSAQEFYQSLQLGESVEPFSMIPSSQASYHPLQLGQSAQPCSMMPNAQASYHVEPEPEPDESYPYEHIGAGRNLSPYYYKGNTSVQSYPDHVQTLPFQNIPNLPHGFQHNGITDMDVLQADMFNYKDERN